MTLKFNILKKLSSFEKVLYFFRLLVILSNKNDTCFFPPYYAICKKFVFFDGITDSESSDNDLSESNLLDI